MINNNIIYNILILAHSFDTTKITQEYKNYNFLVVKNSIEAIHILENNDISLVILDIDLEGFNFIDILEEFNEKKLLNNCLVLALSTIENPKVLKDVLKSGASDFLKKPFINDEFILKIELLIKKLLDNNLIEKQKREIENTLKKFRALIDSSINAMYIFKDNICVECNNEASLIFGFNSKQEIIDKHIFDIFYNVSQKHQSLLEDNEVNHNFQTVVTSQKGDIYQVQIKERNIPFDTDNLKIISAMDITEIKKNEKILAQKSKLASMGEMIGNIAHQWRQPLTAISIAASGIKLMHECGIEDENETMDSLDNIVRNTKFLSSTIEDFQNFIRNDRESSTFFLQDVLRSTLMILDANIKLENVKIIQNYKQDMEITTIQNDIVQILLNIINNAIDVLKNKPEDDRFIFIDIYKNKEMVYISLLDSAGGISENVIDKIFEPYFTTKHQAQGTGLGLYMTHQILSKLDGKIDVKNESFSHENKEYQGAKFTLCLPIF
jgi:PAS domain S-box-containing protein